jgi:hypothetical protein
MSLCCPEFNKTQPNVSASTADEDDESSDKIFSSRLSTTTSPRPKKKQKKKKKQKLKGKAKKKDDVADIPR